MRAQGAAPVGLGGTTGHGEINGKHAKGSTRVRYRKPLRTFFPTVEENRQAELEQRAKNPEAAV